MKRLFAILFLCGFLIPCAYGDTSQGSRISIAIPIIVILLMALIFWFYTKQRGRTNKDLTLGDVTLIIDEMDWAKRAVEEIEALDKNDSGYEDKKWFFEQVFLFYSDRTMHHPNPGITLGQTYDWDLPADITRSYTYDPARQTAQENNPYMHPWLLKYEIMGKMGDEEQRNLYDKLNDAADEYKKGDISFLDFYLVREMVYREIPKFSNLYEGATMLQLIDAVETVKIIEKERGTA